MVGSFHRPGMNLVAIFVWVESSLVHRPPGSYPVRLRLFLELQPDYRVTPRELRWDASLA